MVLLSAPVAPFLAFLLRHLGAIQPDTIALVYDRPNQPSAQTILAGLHRVAEPLLCVSLPMDRQSVTFNPMSNRILFVVLLSEANFSSTVQDYQVLGNDHYDHKHLVVTPAVQHWPRHLLSRNAIYHVLDEPLAFDVRQWHRLLTIHVRRLSDEAALIASHHWLLFLGSHQSLPPGMHVSINYFMPNLCHTAQIRFENRKYVTGIEVGRFRIVAERLGCMVQHVMDDQRMEDTTPIVHHLDTRLSARNIRAIERKEVYSVSFAKNGQHKVWAFSGLKRILVVAPRRRRRRIDRTSTQWLGHIWRRALSMSALLGLAVQFGAIRCGCRWVVGIPCDFVRMGLDTLCRLLSISSDLPLGNRSTAERQLQIVVSLLAILGSSLFNSAIYGELLTPDPPELYSTVAELCDHRIEIQVPTMVFDMEWQRFPTNCILEAIKSKIEFNTAYVVEESTANMLVQLGGHHLLETVFDRRPDAISFSHWFLVQPVLRVLQRCSDHGFDSALRSARNHSLKLRWRQFEAFEPPHQVSANRGDLDIDLVVVLAIGWSVACLAFAGEWLSNWRVHPRRACVEFGKASRSTTHSQKHTAGD